MYVNNDEQRRRTQEERRAATRRVLLDVARELFTVEGYAGAATEGVVRRAGVTRGALYHHFADKRDLFRAVVDEIEEELDGLIREAAREAYQENPDPEQAFDAGVGAFLDACMRPEVGQVLFVDGPSVLGWDKWREIEDHYALGQIEAGLEALIEAGRLERQPVRPLARLLHGASIEAALYVAFAEDRETAKREMRDAMEQLLGWFGENL